jgi:hypothetical protein
MYINIIIAGGFTAAYALGGYYDDFYYFVFAGIAIIA